MASSVFSVTTLLLNATANKTSNILSLGLEKVSSWGRQTRSSPPRTRWVMTSSCLFQSVDDCGYFAGALNASSRSSLSGVEFRGTFAESSQSCFNGGGGISIKAENLSSDVIQPIVYILRCSGIQSSVSVVFARSSPAQLDFFLFQYVFGGFETVRGHILGNLTLLRQRTGLSYATYQNYPWKST